MKEEKIEMRKKSLAMLLASAMVVGILAGCGGPKVDVPTAAPSQAPTESTAPVESAAPELTFAPGTELRMATGYNNTKTGLTFDPDVAKDGITLADGKTYNAGDLKPTWAELENILGMKFTSVYTGQSDSKEFDYWKEKLDEVDMVSGTAKQLSEFGVAGSIVNIAEYLDMMPNFKAYLDANPIVYMSIVGDTSNGAIYLSPYFDGVDDIERMPLMRADWVVKLLDGEGEFTADKTGKTAAPVYKPYMPTSGKVEIDVVEPDGVTVKKIAKDYDKAGNIVDNMNKAGSMDGVAAVNMLRKYIDEAYDGYYGTTRSNLFVGQNAAWDVDELVALLRCVTSNAFTLNGTDSVQGIFSREDNNNQRRVDVFRFAGHLFGVRGLEARYNWMYVDNDGKLHDSRTNPDTYKAMEKMNDMVKEGLISEAFVNKADEKTQTYLENDLGFMHYDYNQTQTIYNESGVLQEGEKYMAAMPPVALWQDGANGGTYMRFTESWRSVKTGGWGISKAGVADNQDKLYACLKLIDYAYSPEGQILMSYGPKAWQSDKTFMFNGTEMPEISDAARAELWSLAKGNYTNYARQYLGSTLSFLKSQAFEFQCTTEVGREGAGYISNAIAAGTIKHPILGVVEDNMWYTSTPTILPLTQTDNDMINSYTDLGNERWGVSKDQSNALLELITGGYAAASKLVPGAADADSAAKVVAEDFNANAQMTLVNDTWQRSLDFYQTIK